MWEQEAPSEDSDAEYDCVTKQEPADMGWSFREDSIEILGLACVLVSRKGRVGPSQRPTIALTQSQGGSEGSHGGIFDGVQEALPCGAGAVERLPFAPTTRSIAQIR